MTKKQAEKLLEYEANGYRIDIQTGYVDSDVCLCVDDEGEICYNSQVFSERPLSDVRVYDVSVSKRVEDWFDKEATND